MQIFIWQETVTWRLLVIVWIISGREVMWRTKYDIRWSITAMLKRSWHLELIYVVTSVTEGCAQQNSKLTVFLFLFSKWQLTWIRWWTPSIQLWRTTSGHGRNISCSPKKKLALKEINCFSVRCILVDLVISFTALPAWPCKEL